MKRFNLFWLYILCSASFLYAASRNVAASLDSTLGLDAKYGRYWEQNYYDSIPHIRAEPPTLELDFKAVSQRYQSPEFAYSESIQEKASFWRKLKSRIGEFIDHLFPDWGYSSNFSEIFYDILALIGLIAFIWIIYRLVFRGNKVYIQHQQESVDQSPVEYVEKNLMDSSIQPYITQAIAQKDFALAIRFMHLLNVQRLAQTKQIIWKLNKTNAMISQEIISPAIKADFQRCTHLFEYVWFGNFEVDEAAFISYQQVFQQFQSQLQ